MNNKIKVETKFSEDSGIVTNSITDINGEIYQSIMRTRDKQTRDALIEMGWMPPEAIVTADSVLGLKLPMSTTNTLLDLMSDGYRIIKPASEKNHEPKTED